MSEQKDLQLAAFESAPTVKAEQAQCAFCDDTGQIQGTDCGQCAPERVSVPLELLERLETWVTDDCSALEELRAILASLVGGVKHE